MSKTKKNFLNWLKTYSSLDKIEPSAWDDKISEPATQKAIRKSTQVQACYAYIESNIAHQYAKLISAQLNNAFSKLDRKDFMVPKGLSDRTKGSANLRSYLELRDLQDKFIRTDIIKCDKDTRVHAFRRWISVVEILIRKHHYEGAFGLLLTLSTIDDQYKLSPSLPTYSREIFDSLLKLISPIGNFRVLRQCIDEARRKKTSPVVFPFVIFSKDITNLNEYLGDEQDKALKEIDKTHPAYIHFTTREDMLDEFMSAQLSEPSVLPEHLQILFDKLISFTGDSVPEGKISLDEPSVGVNSSNNSTLYRQQLQPTLWSKRGRLDKSDYSHWKEIFHGAELPSPLQ